MHAPMSRRANRRSFRRSHLAASPLSLLLAGLLAAACGSNEKTPETATSPAMPMDPAPGMTAGEAMGQGGDAPTGDAPGAANDPAPLPELVRLVSVGDSTTQSTCWRALLWQHLEQDFPGRVDFVGSHQSDSGCMVAGSDNDNEAYGSALVTEVAAGVTDRRTCNPACPTLDDLRTHFAATPADIAFVHFATNDVWNGINPGSASAPEPGSILAAYDSVLEALRAANPNVRVFTAQIIPMNVTETTCSGCTCAECPDRIAALNARMTEWASAHATATSPISVVDQWTGFDAAADTRDGVHPNTAGSQKMADRWFAALAPLLE
ncbi:MAG TPA: GDSL-type esterase/lipase family protein [Polyangiaceae bacterium]|nr:GDSL-type esterase/lipase family protein [Polyangiaceae bacterium]